MHWQWNTSYINNTMDTAMHWVGISGSLRKDSYNTLLLKAAAALLPQDVTMEIASIDLPLYNGDNDLPIAHERPVVVQQSREIFAKADGFVIVSPEYNYSIPGGLKNLIDWHSRNDDSPLLNKPVALMGATPGMWGTVRMQSAFHSIFQALNMKPVNKYEILLSQANKKFDETGKLTDEKAIELVGKKLQALKETILQLKK